MELTETYGDIVRPCLVAFIRRYIEAAPGGGVPSRFPDIIGTGFVVDEDGLIVTNRHVADAFRDAPQEVLDRMEMPVAAAFFHHLDGKLHMPTCAVEQAVGFTVPRELLTEYCPKPPDLAFVRIGVRGLQSLELDEATAVVEGMELATSGFPMGTEALMAPGYLTQITPTLQKGIVSAVLPFPCSHPHAFLINVMIRGGGSGSPVFFPDTGRVGGMVYAGLHDYEVSEVCTYRVPTNLSYVLPARVVAALLREFQTSGESHVDPEAPTMAELLEKGPKTEGPPGFPWEPIPTE